MTDPIRIAILVGVPDYERLPALPACANDVAQMVEILRATGAYDDVEKIVDGSSADTKDTIRRFFEKHRGATIGEVFFYYSGHGTYDDDLLLCCTDYAKNRPRTTSIENKEIDELIRSVKPGLAVKVIDACNSGVPYIKDSGDAVEKSLKSSGLSSVRFMASCHLEQSAFANKETSFFTRAFVEGCLQRTAGTILYRDIEAFIADRFSGLSGQSPHFVTQGTGLEEFATVGDKLRAVRSRLLRPGPSEDRHKSDGLNELLQRYVDEQDTLYVNREDANNAVTTARDDLAALQPADSDVAKFYEYEADFGQRLAGLPCLQSLASSGKEASWPESYFVTIRERMVEREFPAHDMFTGFSVQALLNPKYVKREVVEPYSISSTEDLPFEVAMLRAISRHRSLPEFCVYLALIHSDRKVLLLRSFADYTVQGWDTRAVDESTVLWQQNEMEWKKIVEDPSMLWRAHIDEFESRIKEALRARVEEREP